MELNGKIVANIIEEKVTQLANNFFDKYNRKTHLVVIKIGDNPASEIYVNIKRKACLRCGIKSSVIEKKEINQNKLIDLIKSLNNCNEVDGILLQLPLPKGLDEIKIIENIDKDKDVDGITPYNVGLLNLNRNNFIPCTPFGILRILEYYNIEVAKKNVAVLGRSNIVGKPIATLLTEKNATVTLCHSKTQNLKAITKRSDIIIVAIGKAGFLTKDMVSQDSFVIDVAINRNSNNKICGDADYENLKDYVRGITPVPNGVGPMTVAMLLANTVQAAYLQKGANFAKDVFCFTNK